MIHVVAIITTKPGLRDTVLAAFRDNLAAVRAENGCIEYILVVDAEDAPANLAKAGPDSFLVIEKWSDADALKAHAASAHMAAYAARVKDHLASRTVYVLSSAE